MPITQAHDRYMTALLDKLYADRFPSGEIMDRVEILLDREHVDEYVDMLLRHIEECRYPSKQMMDRVSRWVLAAS
jgi:hypothetical protein